MATPCKTVARSSKAIFSIFRILKRRRHFVWRFSTRRAAVLFRNRLYAFRSTFLSDPAAPPDLTRVVCMTKMKIKDKTLILEFDNAGHAKPNISRSH